jgi:hypothetical protein
MTCVVNDGGLTVIILETEEETQALVDLLSRHPTLSEDYPALDVLTNEMMTLEPHGADPKSSISDPWVRSAIVVSDKELSTPSREAEQGAWLD